MADTIVEFDFAPGASPTLTLFTPNSDTIRNGAGDGGSEQTNRGGTYLATVTEELVGWHKAYVTIGSTTMPIGWVDLADDTGTYTVQTGKAIIDLLEADWYIDTSPTPWQAVLVKKGTGALGVGTELLRQNLKDESGSNVSAIASFLGQRVTP